MPDFLASETGSEWVPLERDRSIRTNRDSAHVGHTALFLLVAGVTALAHTPTDPTLVCWRAVRSIWCFPLPLQVINFWVLRGNGPWGVPPRFPCACTPFPV